MFDFVLCTDVELHPSCSCAHSWRLDDTAVDSNNILSHLPQLSSHCVLLELPSKHNHENKMGIQDVRLQGL